MWYGLVWFGLLDLDKNCHAYSSSIHPESLEPRQDSLQAFGQALHSPMYPKNVDQYSLWVYD